MAELRIPDDPRTNYCIMVFVHTDDAKKCLDNPETVRRIVADAFDELSNNYDHAPAKIEEEIDYTLDVYRTECDKDVTTNRIAKLEATIERLKAPVSDEELDLVRKAAYLDEGIDALISARAKGEAKQ